jgi:hypothetical protein
LNLTVFKYPLPDEFPCTAWILRASSCVLYMLVVETRFSCLDGGISFQWLATSRRAFGEHAEEAFGIMTRMEPAARPCPARQAMC